MEIVNIDFSISKTISFINLGWILPRSHRLGPVWIQAKWFFVISIELQKPDNYIKMFGVDKDKDSE